MLHKWQVSGIDLAWGYKMPDAIACGVLEKREGYWSLSEIDIHYEKYEVADLTEFLSHGATNHLIAVDAPLVCTNLTGARAVDKECSALYRKYEAGCHPVNLSLVTRPLELAEVLRKKNVSISPEWQQTGMRALEVYPHPTMIHWFGLEKTIKYKKGRVAEKRKAFSDYQLHLRNFLNRWNGLEIQYPDELKTILSELWSKKVEDKLDAFFCLLIASVSYTHLTLPTIYSV